MSEKLKCITKEDKILFKILGVIHITIALYMTVWVILLTSYYASTISFVVVIGIIILVICGVVLLFFSRLPICKRKERRIK